MYDYDVNVCIPIIKYKQTKYIFNINQRKAYISVYWVVNSKEVLRIKEVMKEKDVSGVELAKAVGISTNTLSGYNVGRYWPNADVLLAIADYLGVDIRDLFHSTKPENKRRIDIHIEDENGVMRPWNEVIK